MRDSREPYKTLQFCKSVGVDFVFLQETHIVNENDVYTWSYDRGAGLHASFGSTCSCGSLIFVSPRWTPLVGKVDHRHEGRLACITMKHPSGSFFPCNVYAPNQPTNKSNQIRVGGAPSDVTWVVDEICTFEGKARNHQSDFIERLERHFFKRIDCRGLIINCLVAMTRLDRFLLLRLK